MNVDLDRFGQAADGRVRIDLLLLIQDMVLLVVLTFISFTQNLLGNVIYVSIENLAIAPLLQAKYSSTFIPVD